MVESDSEHWVRVLLTETRARRDENGEFIAEVDGLEASRAALSSRVREQAAFISVLQVGACHQMRCALPHTLVPALPSTSPSLVRRPAHRFLSPI